MGFEVWRSLRRELWTSLTFVMSHVLRGSPRGLALPSIQRRFALLDGSLPNSSLRPSAPLCGQKFRRLRRRFAAQCSDGAITFFGSKPAKRALLLHFK